MKLKHWPIQCWRFQAIYVWPGLVIVQLPKKYPNPLNIMGECQGSNDDKLLVNVLLAFL